MGSCRFLLLPTLVVVVALLLSGDLQAKIDHVRTIAMALQTLFSFEKADFDAMLNSCVGSTRAARCVCCVCCVCCVRHYHCSL